MRFFYIYLILFLFASTTYSQHTLQFNLNKGENYTQKTNSTITITQEVYGQEMHIEMDILAVMDFLVTQAADTNYTMDVKYTSMEMVMKMPQGDMKLSSKGTEGNNPLSSIFKDMVDKTFQIKMKRNGQIENVENIEEIYENAFANLPVPEAQKEQIKQQILKAYGADAFTGNLEMVTAIFPDNKVKQGDTWSSTNTLYSGMPLDLKTTYTLDSYTNDTVTIIGKTSLNTQETDEYIETNGMEMKYDLDGKMNSTIILDAQTGWIKESKITQTLKGKTSIKGNAQIPDGFEIPMQMETTTTVTDTQ